MDWVFVLAGLAVIMALLFLGLFVRREQEWMADVRIKNDASYGRLNEMWYRMLSDQLWNRDRMVESSVRVEKVLMEVRMWADTSLKGDNKVELETLIYPLRDIATKLLERPLEGEDENGSEQEEGTDAEIHLDAGATTQEAGEGQEA